MGRWASEPFEVVSTLIAQEVVDGGGGSRWAWLADPRTAVLFVLGSAVLIGGGRRLLMASKARKAADRLADPEVSPAEVLDASGHGRAGLIEFYRLLSEGKTPEVREAAGRALAVVWEADDLIPEEEKAVVARGFDVRWRARRRYPRAMRAPIPIEVRYGLPFLDAEGPGISPEDLEWSHQIAGAERAALERPSDWKAGAGLASFTLDPADFPGNGPHRLVLKAKARTGPRLTSSWEIEPPQVPFSFEFDPRLDADALFTLPDEGKRAALASALRLDDAMPEDDGPRFLDLPGPFVMRDPPALWLDVPLASDLAHRIELEFEGIPGRFPAGRVVVSGQDQPAGVVEIPIGPVEGLPPDAFDRPGEHRLRAVLVPDADLGWADPDVRSLWPDPIETDWRAVRLIRR